MPRYRDPRAPAGRVVFGGAPFIDGVTADINPGEGTLALFASAGITELPEEPAPVKPAEAPAEPEKPAPRRKK